MDYNWVVEVYKQKNPQPIPIQNAQCNLVGGTGLIVQMILGFLSFMVLVYKRIQETPQRPFKIWLLDSAKQVLSQLFTHLGNMIFSIILTTPEGVPTPHLMSNYGLYIYGYYTRTSSSNYGFNFASFEEQRDPCNYYFVTVVIDTSCGVFLACFLLMQLDNLLKRKGFESLRTGNYYKETKVFKKRQIVDEDQNVMNVPMEDMNYIEIDYVAWLIQLAIWLTIAFIAKMLLFFIQIFFQEPLGFASYCLLFWLNNYPTIKLVFVMILVPTIMNGMVFWIQDNFLKKKSYSADTEDIEEDDQDKEDVVNKKHYQVSEMYANEEQYSTQMQRIKENKDQKQPQSSHLIPQQNQLNISIDTISQLHNVSFSRNYNENKKKDSMTYIGSELPITLFQQTTNTNGQKGDSVKVYGDDQNSTMNRAFIVSSINTPINSELLEATSNVANQPGANKHSKFAQFKDYQPEGSPTSESIAKDFTSSNILKLQQKSQSNFCIEEELSNHSLSPQKHILPQNKSKQKQ